VVVTNVLQNVKLKRDTSAMELWTVVYKTDLVVFIYRLLGPLKGKYKNRYAIMVIIHT
jgi:hypothetical protein